jgi:hypothetical protein
MYTNLPITNPGFDSLQTLAKPQLESLVDHVDASIPGLRDHLRSLSELLSFLIEHGRLPPYKLRLESFSKDQLESMRSTTWSLKELLEPDGSREGEPPDHDPPVKNSPQTSDCIGQDDLCGSSSPDLTLSAQPTSQAPASPPLHSPVSSANAHRGPSTQGSTSITSSEPLTLMTKFDLEMDIDSDVSLNEDDATLFLPNDDTFDPPNEDDCPTSPNEGDHPLLPNTDQSFLRSPLVLLIHL